MASNPLVITRLNATIERYVGRALAVAFAGLILVVFLQVVARNVLRMPMIWTLDLAQLLFAWCIFIGASLAFRAGAHYIVNLWHGDGLMSRLSTRISTVFSAIVIFVLIFNGVKMSLIGLNRESPSLGFSEFWFFVPIPVCGVFMLLFLVEHVLREWQH